MPPPRFSLPDVEGQAGTYLRNLHREITEYMVKVEHQVNSLSESQLAASYGALTASPVGPIMATGDIVPKRVRSEEGTAGAKYVITGWMAKSDGSASASTILELRSLTGN